jgi:hypothetical protein
MSMIDLRAMLDPSSTDRVGCVSMSPRTDRNIVSPGALVRAGTRMYSEWVRVEAIEGEWVLYTRVMPAAAHVPIESGGAVPHRQGASSSDR